MPTKAQELATANLALDRLQQFINRIVAQAKRGEKRELRQHLLFQVRHRAMHGYAAHEAHLIDKVILRAAKQGLEDFKAGKKVHPIIKQIATAQQQRFD